MSISWDLPGHSQPKDAASSASAGTFLAINRPKTQHHQHQLAPSWLCTTQRLSIMSTSRHLPSRSQPKDAASSASVGTFLAIHSPKTQHQEHQLGPSWLCTARRRQRRGHQLGPSWPFTAQRRSIMSMSWDFQSRSHPTDAASSASAGTFLAVHCSKTQAAS